MRSAAFGRLADDEAVRHVAHARGRRGAERGAARPRARHPHRGLDRRRALVHLLEVAGEVPGEVVERPAGRRHVHEAEQRGAQLGVLRGELHRRAGRARAAGGATSRAGPAWMRAPHLLKLRLHASAAKRSSQRRYGASMPSLVLGPLLRYVGETDAVLWVETDSDVRGRGARRRASAPSACATTTTRSSAAAASSPAPGTSTRCCSTASACGRATTASPPARFHTYPKDTPLKLVFGSCRVAAPHEPPYTLTKDEDARGREIDALHTLAQRMRRPAARGVAGRAPDARRPGVRRRGLARHAARSSRRGATRASRPASAWSTSRSTRSSTWRAGATPRSAGCSRRSRRR